MKTIESDIHSIIVFKALQELNELAYAYDDFVKGAVDSVIHKYGYVVPLEERDELYQATRDGLAKMWGMDRIPARDFNQGTLKRLLAQYNCRGAEIKLDKDTLKGCAFVRAKYDGEKHVITVYGANE